MKREKKAYQFILQAMTPIHHGQETFGNVTTILRLGTRLPDGSFTRIPAISGDTMRHLMREAISYVFLDTIGMLVNPSLTEAAERLLFNGGTLTGRGKGKGDKGKEKSDANVIRLDEYRELCELVPSLALFGGCASRIIPGRLVSEDANLICEERKHLTPDWIVAAAGHLSSHRSHVELEQRVRMDPMLVPEKRALLSPEARIDVENRMLMSESAHIEDDAELREESKSSMMPRQYEVIVAGSLLSWQVVATCYTDLDVDVFNSSVAAALADCRVGGKRGTGHGSIRAIQANQIHIANPEERLHPLDTTALAPKVGELFRAHVRERKDRIASFLSKVDA